MSSMREFWANEAAKMRDTSGVLGKDVLTPVERKISTDKLMSGRYVTSNNEFIVEVKNEVNNIETKPLTYLYRQTNNPRIETPLIFDSKPIVATIKTFVVVGKSENAIIKAIKASKITDSEKIAILNNSVDILQDLLELPPLAIREHIINYLNGAYYYDDSKSRELGDNPNTTARSILDFELGGIIFYFNENSLGYLTARDGKKTTPLIGAHVDVLYPFLSIGIMAEKYKKFMDENVKIFSDKYFRLNTESDRVMNIRGKAEKLPYVVSDQAIKFTWHSHPEGGWTQPPSTDDYNFNRRFDKNNGVMFIISKQENRVYLLNRYSPLRKTENEQSGFFSGFMSITNFIK